MIRKTLFRLIRATCLGMGLVIASLGVAGYLALSEPAFYRSLRTDEPTPAQVEAAGRQLQQERTDYLAWSRQVRADRAGRPRRNAPPAPLFHEVRFTSAQLNALVAAETGQLAGGALEDPRVRVTPGRLELACGVLTPAARCVVSAELAPSLTPDGVLTLDVVSARVGRLPFPCKTLQSFFPGETHRLKGDLCLDLTGTRPRFTLDLADKANKKATLLAESIECGAGDVTVRFVVRPDDQ